MSRNARIALSTTVLVSLGCRAPAVDVATEGRRLLEVDRAWAVAAGSGQSADSLVSFWSDDARVGMSGQPVVQGKAAIKGMVTSMMAIPGFHITWTADSAIVSSGGDLGYTYGTNEVTLPDSTGKAVTTRGNYVAVWRKDSDGRWRCVMDYAS